MNAASISWIAVIGSAAEEDLMKRSGRRAISSRFWCARVRIAWAGVKLAGGNTSCAAFAQLRQREACSFSKVSLVRSACCVV